jgi:hypothetical protein
MNSEGRLMNEQHKAARRSLLKEGKLPEYEVMMLNQQRSIQSKLEKLNQFIFTQTKCTPH